MLAVKLLFALAQVIQTGDPTVKYCSEIEHIRPNLELEQSAQVHGTIMDSLGGPLNNSRVELRKYESEKKQVSVAVVQTDCVGHYDLGMVPAGRYRLLGSATRALKQPEGLKCTGSNCEINIKLQWNKTDQPDSICPVK